MRKATIAERLLAVATTPDRAAAVVGDLLEEEATHGHRRFWLDVVRTVLALIWLDFLRLLAGRHPAFSGADMMGPLMNTLRFMWSRKWIVVIPVLLLTTVTSLVAYSRPVRYRSETRLMFVTQGVPEEYVRPTSEVQPHEQMRWLNQALMSRTRLEQLINEFDLYQARRQTGIMQDVVERMQEDIDVRLEPDETIAMSFTSDDPRKAQKVTERIAALFINEFLTDRARRAEGTAQFLDGQIEELATRLDTFAVVIDETRGENRVLRSRMLQYEVVQQTYRDLLVKRENARLAASLETRQIGSQVRVIDAARMPTQPEGPGLEQLTLSGAAAGLVLGLALMLVSSRRPPRVPPLAESRA